MPNPFIGECKRRRWKSYSYKALSFDSLKERRIPARHGVYIIRAPYDLHRVQGKSSVVYIGQAGGWKRRGGRWRRGGAQGIGPGNRSQGRLFNTRGPDEKVRKRIESLCPGRWFTVKCNFTRRNANPKNVERGLLKAYERTHFELPPANHSSP